MSNHFHILATSLELEAKKASKQELLRRYKLIYPKESEPPPGRYEPNGEIIPDEDGGIERLQERLGSISRFVQELKQPATTNRQQISRVFPKFLPVPSFSPLFPLSSFLARRRRK